MPYQKIAGNCGSYSSFHQQYQQHSFNLRSKTLKHFTYEGQEVIEHSPRMDLNLFIQQIKLRCGNVEPWRFPEADIRYRYATLTILLDLASQVFYGGITTTFLLTKDKKIYNTHRVEVFYSIEWLWSPLPDLVKLPLYVSLTDPQPITTRGSIYMLLTNGDILRVDAYSATWDILTTPAPTLDYDQDATPKELVKYLGKLGFAFKPPDGCWEIWVLKIDRSWEKVDDFAMNQDIENQLIKAHLCDALSPHIFSFRSDSEPIDLMVG